MLEDAVLIDDHRSFSDLLENRIKREWNVTAQDILQYLLKFRSHFLQFHRRVVPVPYTCIGYLLFGCTSQSLRLPFSINGPNLARLIYPVVQDVVEPGRFDELALLPAVFGFDNVLELLEKTRLAWRQRRRYVSDNPVRNPVTGPCQLVIS